jgi:uncharacterized protein YkwD
MLLDAAIVAVLGSFVWRGWRKGLLLTLTGFAGFVAATVVAVLGFRIVGRPLEAAGLSTGVANLIGAAGLFIVVSAGAFIVGRTLTRMLSWSKLGIVNNAGGAALAGGWALSWMTLLLLAISVIPAPAAVASQVESSTLAKGIVREAPRWALSFASTDLRDALRFFVPGPHEVSLVATQDFRRSPAGERDLFDRLNEERRTLGRDVLAWSDALASVARAHAADMYRRGFFSHRTPDGVTLARRLRGAKVRFEAAGENLVLSPNTRIAHARLMSSEDHRKHILDRRFDAAGLGVMLGRQGVLVVQVFIAA